MTLFKFAAGRCGHRPRGVIEASPVGANSSPVRLWHAFAVVAGLRLYAGLEN